MVVRRLLTNLLLGVAVVVASIGSQPAAASTPGSGQTRMISAGGTARFVAGAPDTTTGVTSLEIPNSGGDGALQSNRSRSSSDASTPVGALSQPRNVTTSTPGLLGSFNGLNHYQQRFGSTAGGNQWSLEPPDQGLCVGTDGSGNVRVVEAVNDVMRVYDTSGNGLTAPTALNGFLGYAPAIVRGADPLYGPFVTDPSCLYDSTTGRWFLVVLTLDSTVHTSDGLQDYLGTDHLDLAVSNSHDPAGSWTVYRIPVQDDGTAGTPNHHCSAGPHSTDPWVTNPTGCFGDYPHIGSDANGIYLTTNEYSFFGPEFRGAQIYAFSKAQLASTPATVSVTQIDTHAMDTFGFGLNGFTLWPSVTPGSSGYGAGDPAANGTEHFLSTNAAAEAHDTGDGTSHFQASTQLLSWTLTNTASLGGSPALSLSSSKLDVGQYTLPPSSAQKSGNQPQKTCDNNNPCSIALNGIKDPFAEKSANLDSNDTRMQQTTWVNGSLWGAIDTGLATSNGKQAGIEWFDVSTGSSTLAGQGYVGLGNDNLTYPAIGITAAGTGVMAFTVVGSNFYPSAGYAIIGANGVSDVHIAAMGLGPEDGFTNYRINANPPNFIARPRWGDYGAAVPWGNSVWLASEYIPQTCDFSTYRATNFRCGNTRTAFGNWGTRISLVSAA